jgi:hypothetical protein
MEWKHILFSFIKDNQIDQQTIQRIKEALKTKKQLKVCWWCPIKERWFLEKFFVCHPKKHSFCLYIYETFLAISHSITKEIFFPMRIRIKFERCFLFNDEMRYVNDNYRRYMQSWATQFKKRPIQLNSTQFMSWNELNWACFFRVDELGWVESRKFSELMSWIELNRAKFVNAHELNWIELKKKSYNEGIELNWIEKTFRKSLNWIELSWKVFFKVYEFNSIQLKKLSYWFTAKMKLWSKNQ